MSAQEPSAVQRRFPAAPSWLQKAISPHTSAAHALLALRRMCRYTTGKNCKEGNDGKTEAREAAQKGAKIMESMARDVSRWTA